MELDWKGLIPIYLNIINSSIGYECMDKKKKIHFLIVEGKNDRDYFYYPVLKFNIIDTDNKKYNFSILKKNIIFDISNCFLKVQTPDQMFSEKIINDLKDKYNSINEQQKIYKFDFVIEFINSYNNMYNKLKNIDCYGIIDRDFGHEIPKEKISMTETHDFETTLVRLYMDDYFDLICDEKKEKAIKVLADTLDFTFKQGILENESFKFVRNHPEELNKTIIEFTHNYFKNNSNKEKFIRFDFDTYFKKYNFFYQELINNYKMELKKVYNFKDELVNILKRWLIDKKTSSIDNKMLDRIFYYTNGHILLNQLICNGEDIFRLSNKLTEKIFVDNFVKKIIKTKYKKIYRTLPLIKYKEYRIENGFFN